MTRASLHAIAALRSADKKETIKIYLNILLLMLRTFAFCQVKAFVQRPEHAFLLRSNGLTPTQRDMHTFGVQAQAGKCQTLSNGFV